RRHTRFSRDWSSDVCSSDLDGKLMGVLSIEELLENIVTPKPGSSTVKMKDLVQPATDIAQMGMNMGQVIQIMDKKNTRFLPVVRSEERRVGIECGFNLSPDN